jgi:hypothetical protein
MAAVLLEAILQNDHPRVLRVLKSPDCPRLNRKIPSFALEGSKYQYLRENELPFYYLFAALGSPSFNAPLINSLLRRGATPNPQQETTDLTPLDMLLRT